MSRPAGKSKGDYSYEWPAASASGAIEMNPFPSVLFMFLGLIVLVWVVRCLNILPEYERAVVFRLGRVLRNAKGPAWC